VRYASFGPISSGTLRTEDLLSTFASELDSLLRVQPRSFKRRALRTLISEANRTDPDSEFASDIVDEMQDALNEFAPPYGYFGTFEGDGAEFGFFLGDIDDSFDGLRVNDTSDVPSGYRGEVLHVNDHGNVTLYVAISHGKLKEIWAIV
jgi:hypothetical protein